jgi:hypothetical protein
VKVTVVVQYVVLTQDIEPQNIAVNLQPVIDQRIRRTLRARLRLNYLYSIQTDGSREGFVRWLTAQVKLSDGGGDEEIQNFIHAAHNSP